MRTLLISSLLFSFTLLSMVNDSLAAPRRGRAPVPGEVKEWTFLSFMNGKNSLDSYTELNLNQMETVGSTDQVNFLVQWASSNRRKVQRLYVTRDNNTQRVSSPVIQDLGGSLDMGDYRNLIDFIRWGVENYPAKKYMITVWDHGSGWHFNPQTGRWLKGRFPVDPRMPKLARPDALDDISNDDETGNVITTEQLGVALNEAARMIGHKVDFYASDACLMGMIEVAAEMADAVQIYAGSQELEPGEGWPYDAFFAKWVANPTMGPTELAKILAVEYTKSYSAIAKARGYRHPFKADEVTFSAFDLQNLPAIGNAMMALGKAIVDATPAEKQKIIAAASRSQKFYYSDYMDAWDFIKHVETMSGLQSLFGSQTASVKQALSQFVIANQVTPKYSRAGGMSVWFPSAYVYKQYAQRYFKLRWNQHTGWGAAMGELYR